MKISNRFFTSKTRKVEQVEGRYWSRKRYPDGIEVEMTLSSSGWDSEQIKIELSASEAHDLVMQILSHLADQRREAERRERDRKAKEVPA